MSGKAKSPADFGIPAGHIFVGLEKRTCPGRIVFTMTVGGNNVMVGIGISAYAHTHRHTHTHTNTHTHTHTHAVCLYTSPLKPVFKSLPWPLIRGGPNNCLHLTL